MKIAWFNDNRLGLVEGDTLRDVTAALKVLPAPSYPGPWGDLLIANLDRVRQEIKSVAPSAPQIDARKVKFLSPVAHPSKIIGVPVNYLKHVEEADANKEVFSYARQGGIEEQGLFLKASSSLVGAGQGVTVRFPDRRTDHEMELGIVIGRKISNISEAEAMDAIAGYAIALDMVVRGPEDRSFRKSVDSYAVLGPWLVTADEIADAGNLEFSLAVNGQVKQASNTKHLIMKIPRQVAWASTFYTLYPGDIIMSGTCEGVSQVVPGDVMHCKIDQIGAMDVKVA